MIATILLLLPWVIFAVAVPLRHRRRPQIRDYPAPAAASAPRVTIIVPARNEAANIGECLATLLDTNYPAADVVMVDDRSTDGTGLIAAALAERSDGRLRVVEGEPLPAGWFGKPWACWQGYRAAEGELLLFTDADTRHEPELLGHAVGALLHERADLVTVLPRQVMGGFWERAIMPQVWLALTLRFPDPGRINFTREPRAAVANGQFILARRDAYEAAGGHEAVRGEVVEDLRLAQRFVEAGKRIFVAFAEELMRTRMYTSLAGIIEGWTKNLALGSRQAAPAWLRPVAPWGIAAFLLVYWVLPPVALAAWVVGIFGAAVRDWAIGATAVSLAFWILLYVRLGLRPGSAFAYPLGAAVAAWIVIRSTLRGERIEWKGRTYGESKPQP